MYCVTTKIIFDCLSGILYAAKHLPNAKHVRIVYNEFEVPPADSMNLDRDLEQVLAMEKAQPGCEDPMEIDLSISGMNMLFVIQVKLVISCWKGSNLYKIHKHKPKSKPTSKS